MSVYEETNEWCRRNFKCYQSPRNRPNEDEKRPSDGAHSTTEGVRRSLWYTPRSHSVHGDAKQRRPMTARRYASAQRARATTADIHKPKCVRTLQFKEPTEGYDSTSGSAGRKIQFESRVQKIIEVRRVFREGQADRRTHHDENEDRYTLELPERGQRQEKESGTTENLWRSLMKARGSLKQQKHCGHRKCVNDGECGRMNVWSSWRYAPYNNSSNFALCGRSQRVERCLSQCQWIASQWGMTNKSTKRWRSVKF